MELRSRRDFRGTAFGVEAQGAYGYSVRRGDLIECDELTALRLLLSGEAQTDLTGPLGNWGQLLGKGERDKLQARIAELTPRHPDEETDKEALRRIFFPV